MVLQAVSVLLYTSSFIIMSESDCYVGNLTYELNERWYKKEECVAYDCLESGPYTLECDKLPDPIPEDWSVNPGNLSAVFPWCCTTAYPPFFNYSLPGCTIDNQTVPVGKQYDLPDQCYYHTCKGNDEWIVGECGLMGLFTGYQETHMNTSLPFPQCCGSTEPLLDIVPDVLDQLDVVEYLDVVYDGNTAVHKGNELTPSQVKNRPEVNFTADPNGWYTLCMTDPDVPSRQEPTRKEFKHWLVGNIPGNKVSEGEVIADYIRSGPPKGSGLHRYFFLVYKQPGKLTFDESKVSNTSIEGRRFFSVRKFAEKYKLEGPVALNVYQAQWDDYVPVLYEQLGFTKN